MGNIIRFEKIRKHINNCLSDPNADWCPTPFASCDTCIYNTHVEDDSSGCDAANKEFREYMAFISDKEYSEETLIQMMLNFGTTVIQLYTQVKSFKEQADYILNDPSSNKEKLLAFHGILLNHAKHQIDYEKYCEEKTDKQNNTAKQEDSTDGETSH